MKNLMNSERSTSRTWSHRFEAGVTAVATVSTINGREHLDLSWSPLLPPAIAANREFQFEFSEWFASVAAGISRSSGAKVILLTHFEAPKAEVWVADVFNPS